MPSNVAVVRDLEYDATDLQDFPRIFLEIHEGGPWWTPETRGDDSTVPRRTGQIERARKAHRLPILLKGRVQGEGDTEDEQRADTFAALLELVALFDPVLPARTLSCTLPTGQTATISARAEVFVPEANPRIPTTLEVQARLIAIDPPEWELGGS